MSLEPSTSQRKKLVVVGNAEPRENLSAFIDQCDTVIRFNRTPFFDTGKTGRKTTILCLHGIPYPSQGEIPELNRTVAESCEMFWVETSLLVEPLQKGYNVQSQEIVVKMLKSIRDPIDRQISQAESITRPSSGFQVLRYLVNTSAFADFDKFFCCFTFQGGPCHQWELEKEQVARYVELGLLTPV